MLHIANGQRFVLADCHSHAQSMIQILMKSYSIRQLLMLQRRNNPMATKDLRIPVPLRLPSSVIKLGDLTVKLTGGKYRDRTHFIEMAIRELCDKEASHIPELARLKNLRDLKQLSKGK
jgi:hypothetical protein